MAHYREKAHLDEERAICYLKSVAPQAHTTSTRKRKKRENSRPFRPQKNYCYAFVQALREWGYDRRSLTGSVTNATPFSPAYVLRRTGAGGLVCSSRKDDKLEYFTLPATLAGGRIHHQVSTQTVNSLQGARGRDGGYCVVVSLLDFRFA